MTNMENRNYPMTWSYTAVNTVPQLTLNFHLCLAPRRRKISKTFGAIKSHVT